MLDRLKKLKTADAGTARTSGGSSSGSKGVTLPGFERESGKEGVPPTTGELLIMNKSQAESRNVVTGIFPVLSVPTLVLFDSGASNSFISSKLVRELGIVPSAATRIAVKVASGEIKACEHIFEGVPIKIKEVTFPSDLIQFDLDDFGVVLGMDWLGRYKAQILCSEQKVVLRGPGGKRVSYRGATKEPEVKLVSMIKIKKYVAKGHEAFLCAVEDLSAPKDAVQ
ncbi:retroviral-like aspartic protease family protein [Morganella morganii]|uniref:retroviral-like aspartic protease family protein n=1 Tax=Morganella morganii TaxID=582 RepID=UPI0032DB73BF